MLTVNKPTFFVDSTTRLPVQKNKKSCFNLAKILSKPAAVIIINNNFFFKPYDMELGYSKTNSMNDTTEGENVHKLKRDELDLDAYRMLISV